LLRVEDIYTQEILELSSQVPTNSRLDNPDVTITKGTPICGSIMTVDLNLKDGMIDDIGLEIRSCALGKASASIFVKNAKGLNLDDVKKVKKDLVSFFKTGDFKMQSAFYKYKYFEPARLVPYRHDSIMLVIDATIEGLETTK
jgi:NifU-like protein involved in Fe-S cluster formation|tara:strand:- start:223 stop:651 length:429 start_codon:yes stop_codon:yes gene_type:complete